MYCQYFEIDGQKLMLDDILKSARNSYRKELIELIATNPNYDSKDNSITIDGEYYDLSDEPLRKLEELVNTLKIENRIQKENVKSNVPNQNNLSIQ